MTSTLSIGPSELTDILLESGFEVRYHGDRRFLFTPSEDISLTLYLATWDEFTATLELAGMDSPIFVSQTESETEDEFFARFLAFEVPGRGTVGEVLGITK